MSVKTTVFTSGVFGLVDKKGNYYPCDDYGHSGIYEEQLGKTWEDMEKEGWLHIGDCCGIYRYDHKKPTSAQIEVLFDALMSDACPKWYRSRVQEYIDRYSN